MIDIFTPPENPSRSSPLPPLHRDGNEAKWEDEAKGTSVITGVLSSGEDPSIEDLTASISRSNDLT